MALILMAMAVAFWLAVFAAGRVRGSAPLRILAPPLTLTELTKAASKGLAVAASVPAALFAVTLSELMTALVTTGKLVKVRVEPMRVVV